MAKTDQLNSSIYFSSPVYSIEIPEWVNDANKVCDKYIKEAKKKSIDQEVETILAGNYLALPSMNQSESIPGSKLNEITIKNITGFTLVIIYSGPVSEKVEVKDGSTYVVKLPNGQYNITATLNSDLIGSFVGKEMLTGGKYETKFFLGY